MAFDRRYLNDGEEVIADLRSHWLPLVPKTAWVVVSLGIGYVAVGFGIKPLEWVAAIGLVLSVANLAFGWLKLRATEFVITTDRLIYRSGVFAKKGIEIPLERVNTVHFSQTPGERLMGTGDLMIESAGEGGQQHFDNLRRPRHVQQLIYSAIEDNQKRNHQAQAEAHAEVRGDQPQSSIPEQIHQLGMLRDRGILTDDEFAAKKRELLDRM